MTTGATPSISVKLLLALVICGAVCNVGCGARDAATGSAQPRGEIAEAVFAPVLLTVSDEREAAVRVAWATLLREQQITADAVIIAPVLTPVTRTPARLPALPTNLRLPRVGDLNANGDERAANEREALRRFVAANATLLGTTPETTTLIRTEELAGGTRRATYEQRPFPYPLRGGYGRIIIDYTTDGRVSNLTSTALPDAVAADAGLRRARARFTADEARTAITDDTARLTELVVFPVVRDADASGRGTIELRLAWEFRVAGDRLVYVDAADRRILVPAAPTILAP